VCSHNYQKRVQAFASFRSPARELPATTSARQHRQSHLHDTNLRLNFISFNAPPVPAIIPIRPRHITAPSSGEPPHRRAIINLSHSVVAGIVPVPSPAPGAVGVQALHRPGVTVALPPTSLRLVPQSVTPISVSSPVR
ncbi:hypothetical protein U1Q18_036064, partial [Sarracenia purpurea var. burkii]